MQPRVDLETQEPPRRPRSPTRPQRASARAPDGDQPAAVRARRLDARIDAAPDERPRGRGPGPEPAPPRRPSRSADGCCAARRPNGDDAATAVPPPPGGPLGEALRNLQKYVQKESFNNSRAGQEFGPLQFDTKGVEFGPWIRRFVAQVRRNWFVPNAAMSMRGHVILTFNIHRNGAITDITVVGPSAVDAFDTGAVNAMLAWSPTEPLPGEYPDDKAFFTVTFYYNEDPPGSMARCGVPEVWAALSTRFV